MHGTTSVAGVPSALPRGALLRGGQYRIEQTLGYGGFAITYLAYDTTLQRLVAIKELIPDGCVREPHTLSVTPQRLTPDQFLHIRQRFLDEARLLAQLHHPSIVRAYDAFEQNNTGYLVMEYLHGQTLVQLLRERGGVIPEHEAVGYILQVCEALQVVHKRGYLHRDIKPSNIIVTQEGRAVLIDLGAAREYALGQTHAHTVMLTPIYAPLEQYSTTAKLDVRTDLYALGATLYHLATGVPPLPAPDQARGLPLAPPHKIAPEVSEAVSHAIVHAMGLHPENRPASVQAWMDELRRAIATLPAIFPPRELVLFPSPLGSSIDLNESIREIASGGTIYLEPGEYVLSKPVNVDKPLRLVGKGGQGAVILKLKDAKDTEDTYVIGCDTKNENELVKLENIMFAYEGSAPANVCVVWSGKVEIISCAFRGGVWDEQRRFGGSGLLLWNKSVVTVKNSVSQGNGLNGIAVRDEATLTAEGNICQQNKQVGIRLAHKARGELRANTCSNNGLHGIAVHDEATLTAEGNICQQNKQVGIRLAHKARGELRANTCSNNGLHGIAVHDEATLTAEGNICQQNKQSGIALFDKARGELRANTCSNNGLHGIGVQDNANLTATENTCDDNARCGIIFIDNTSGEVSRNNCRFNRRGIAVEVNARPFIGQNTLYSNKSANLDDWRR